MAVLAVLFGIGMIVSDVKANYEYERTVSGLWDLSVKASTLELKSQYLDKFVAAVDSAHLSGNDAIVFKTPANDVGLNITALKSLQQRMHEIRGMDVQSFQYQQAISQITAQEQEGATEMLSVIEGAWFLNHHFWLWGWVELLVFLALIVAVIMGVAVASLD